MPDDDREAYLAPYLDAAAEYGAGFSTLLWASPQTQRARFEAIRRAYDLEGRRVLDAGCGRADFLIYLLEHGVRPSEYIGVEAVEPLARAAEAHGLSRARIVRADFVRNPGCLAVGADAIVFSGALNTVDDATFFVTLRHALFASGDACVFNFLSSNHLAGRSYLFWRSPADVKAFLDGLGAQVEVHRGYLTGDCTIAARRPNPV